MVNLGFICVFGIPYFPFLYSLAPPNHRFAWNFGLSRHRYLNEFSPGSTCAVRNFAFRSSETWEDTNNITSIIGIIFLLNVMCLLVKRELRCQLPYLEASDSSFQFLNKKVYLTFLVTWIKRLFEIRTRILASLLYFDSLRWLFYNWRGPSSLVILLILIWFKWTILLFWLFQCSEWAEIIILAYKCLELVGSLANLQA